MLVSRHLLLLLIIVPVACSDPFTIADGGDTGGDTVGDAGGDTGYCENGTTQPCSICAKMIINAGIRNVVYESGYEDPMATEMFREAGVEVVRFEGRPTEEGAS